MIPYFIISIGVRDHLIIIIFFFGGAQHFLPESLILAGKSNISWQYIFVTYGGWGGGGGEEQEEEERATLFKVSGYGSRH